MSNKHISLRLIIMNFLQYAIWGAYLTSMGSFLGKAGLGPQIWLFFATQGFVSIFMPALVGIVADRWIPAQKTLSLCQLIAGVSMLGTGLYAMGNVNLTEGAYLVGPDFNFSIFYILYTISVAFYMPTIALTNSVAYAGLDAPPNDSGDVTGKHKSMSKIGASSLRRTLFLVMSVYLQTAPLDEPVYQFMDRKRAEGKPYRVYMMASANKFLRIYYATVKAYLESLEHTA